MPQSKLCSLGKSKQEVTTPCAGGGRRLRAERARLRPMLSEVREPELCLPRDRAATVLGGSVCAIDLSAELRLFGGAARRCQPHRAHALHATGVAQRLGACRHCLPCQLLRLTSTSSSETLKHHAQQGRVRSKSLLTDLRRHTFWALPPLWGPGGATLGASLEAGRGRQEGIGGPTVGKSGLACSKEQGDQQVAFEGVPPCMI